MTVDLRTNYLGLALANPLVVSACPLTGGVQSLRRLEGFGAAAAVLPSLFEEQIEHDEMASFYRLWEMGAESAPDVTAWFPEMNEYNTGSESYLKLVERAKREVSIPIIASLNGTSQGGWVHFARRIEDAGADALELNAYFIVTDPERTALDVERQYGDLVAAVRGAVNIPVAVKIAPYFTSLPNTARRLADAGADGLVLFNRFLQPDIDLDTIQVAPRLDLSTSAEVRLPLRWIAVLRDQMEGSLAATTGVHTSRDMLKLLLVGADVTMVASALLRFGPGHVCTLLDEVAAWMTEHGCASVEQLKGQLSAGQASNASEFERVNYIKALTSYTSTTR